MIQREPCTARSSDRGGSRSQGGCSGRLLCPSTPSVTSARSRASVEAYAGDRCHPRGRWTLSPRLVASLGICCQPDLEKLRELPCPVVGFRNLQAPKPRMDRDLVMLNLRIHALQSCVRTSRHRDAGVQLQRVGDRPGCFGHHVCLHDRLFLSCRPESALQCEA